MFIHELPQEIINIILEYQGYHKERNGKYIKQIINHPSCDLLKKLPENMKLNRGWGVECEFVKMIYNKKFKFVITIIIYDSYVEWNMQKIPIFKKSNSHILFKKTKYIRCMSHY